MSGYNLIDLLAMIEELGIKRVNEIIDSFSCPAKDVENFLHNTAIPFAEQQVSRITLVFTSYKGIQVLTGYFALAHKDFCISSKHLSNSSKRRISKYAQFDNDLKLYRMPVPLIGQLSKNYTNGYNKLITGDELLKMACDRAKQVHLLVGGKYVYLECEDNFKLLEFYERNGFVNMGQRKLDKDEESIFTGKYLIQMLKDLSKE